MLGRRRERRLCSYIVTKTRIPFGRACDLVHEGKFTGLLGPSTHAFQRSEGPSRPQTIHQSMLQNQSVGLEKRGSGRYRPDQPR